MITKNHASSAKEKVEALYKLMETIQKFGEVETFLRDNQLQTLEYETELGEQRGREEAKVTAESNKFMQEIMGSMQNQNRGMIRSNQQLRRESQQAI